MYVTYKLSSITALYAFLNALLEAVNQQFSPVKLTTPPGPMKNCGVAVCIVTVSGLSGFVLIWFCIAI